MRTQTGTYATIFYPDAYIYSEDVCNIFCKHTSAYMGNIEYLITLTYSSTTPSSTKTIQVRLQGDAQGNAYIDIAPYNRAMVTECAGTLTRLTLNAAVNVGTAETITLLIMHLEPGTGRMMFSSGTAGEAVQPPKEVPILHDNISLLFDLQDTGGDGQLTGCKAGGTWAAWATIAEQTGVDPQIKRYATCTVQPLFADMQARALNHELEAVWQGRIFSVAEACSADKWAWLEWRADQWLNKKSWIFKIKSITRKITGSQDLAVQPFVYDIADLYNTQGVNERNGQGFNRQKNWQIQMQVVVDGLTDREMMYFNDLFTSPEVKVKTQALGIYGDYDLNGVQAAVDGNSLQITYKVERASMTFTLLIADFKQF